MVLKYFLEFFPLRYPYKFIISILAVHALPMDHWSMPYLTGLFIFVAATAAAAETCPVILVLPP